MCMNLSFGSHSQFNIFIRFSDVVGHNKKWELDYIYGENDRMTGYEHVFLAQPIETITFDEDEVQTCEGCRSLKELIVH